MEDWTRVLLYGTFDGFGWDTDGNNNILLVLDNGDKVEIPNHFVKNASDFIEKDKIKLKDIIARMEGLSSYVRSTWLDDILYKFDSDYGTLKYKDGYEQGKLEGLIERERVQVPQFVADWIEEGKKHCKDVADLFGFDFTNEEVGNWFLQEKPFDLVARAWLDGYTVKEKRYTVKIKAVDQYLVSAKDENFLGFLSSKLRTYFTRKELEESGFGWVFDCPGIEIEEAEGEM